MASGSSDGWWHLPRGVRLRWREWDDGEAIVLNVLSGQTHYLDGLSAAVLREIEREPATARRIAARVADAFESEADDALTERVAEICARFDALGLADPESA